MELTTLLNRCYRFKGFVYGKVQWAKASPNTIEVEVIPRRGSKPYCAGCGKRRAGYDRLPERSFEFIPFWGFAVFFRYAKGSVAMPNRREDLIQFYELLVELDHKTGGPRRLSDCNGRQQWPLRGVYFFMEPGEARSDSGLGWRVVRVGTHGLTQGSRSTLWKRLAQHRGAAASGGGNHRGSIFRLLVGTTIVDGPSDCPTWGQGKTAKRDTRLCEQRFEREVSSIIGGMPFLFLDIDDKPAPESVRGVIEKNAIALLSNFKRPPLDPPSSVWRGHRCMKEKVQQSGLWNQDYVNDNYNPAFLQTFKTLIDAMEPWV